MMGDERDEAYALAVGSDGVLYVTGGSYTGPDKDFDYVTIAYAR